MRWRIKLMAHWITEREAIRVKKEAGAAPPWTSDPILANYRFCNVCREDDKVTKWIAANWRIPFQESKNLTAAMVLARLLNNPECLAEVGFPALWNNMDIRERIKARRDRGLKILNPAYVVTTCGVSMDKVDYIVDLATKVFSSGLSPTMGDTLQYFHSKLMEFKGLGTFLAAQVVADLKYVEPLRSALDWQTWAAVGPGSLRGLRAVTGIPDLPEGHFLRVAQKVYAQVFEITQTPLHMQDFQNVCCEFSKYWKAHTGQGTPKQRYHARR